MQEYGVMKHVLLCYVTPVAEPLAAGHSIDVNVMSNI